MCVVKQLLVAAGAPRMAPKSSTNASGPRTRRATEPVPPSFEDAAWGGWRGSHMAGGDACLHLPTRCLGKSLAGSFGCQHLPGMVLGFFSKDGMRSGIAPS